jgi:signal transduction histidine kinase
VALYRIAQESLNNVIKYARASRVEIRLRLACCEAHLEIIDNGIGFDPDQAKVGSLGMRIMRERAEAIQADLQVLSRLGEGTRVSVDWREPEMIQLSEIPTRGEL